MQHTITHNEAIRRLESLESIGRFEASLKEKDPNTELFPFKFRYAIGRNIDHLRPIVEAFHKSKIDIWVENGATVKEGKWVTYPDSDLIKFPDDQSYQKNNADIEALENGKTEVTVFKVSVNLLEKTDIPAMYLSGIVWMIQDADQD